jgi:formylglycine-generating enzyme required for sulfatase activity
MKFNIFITVVVAGLIVILGTVVLVNSRSLPRVPSVDMTDMIYIEKGEFVQHDTNPINGKSYHDFRHGISGFEIAKYEVTYDLWYTVFQWAIKNGFAISNPGQEGYHGIPAAVPTDNKYEPVTMIDFYDAVVWCNAYSVMRGYKPVYKTGFFVIKDSDKLRRSRKPVIVLWNADGYRLPTEGEWRFAASDRGLTDISRIDQNMATNTIKVTETTKNKSGLHGVRSNVWEWCWDWFGNLPDMEANDFRGPLTGDGKILMGGRAYICDHIQAGYRLGIYPETKNYLIGLRVARSRNKM